MPGLFSSLVEALPPSGERLPLTVLTGFLGSGKTSLLNRLLSDPQFQRTAVLINEFGSVGLDHDLVQHTEENMVLLANGCICCTIRGDLVQALLDLARDARVQQGLVERVVLETTGLADPAPILHTVMADPRVCGRFRLAGVACTVDSCNGMDTLDRHKEAVKQVAVADVLMVTKTDLAPALSALDARLHAINPSAPLVHGSQEALASLRSLVCGPGSRDTGGTGDYKPFAYQVLVDEPHDPDRHDDHIVSFSIVREEPLQREGFFAWLDMIAAMRGSDLLRVKGIVHIADSPERPLVIHGVQHIFHPPQWLPAWPSEDRRTRIVFITRDIDRDTIDATLSVFERRRRRV